MEKIQVVSCVNFQAPQGQRRTSYEKAVAEIAEINDDALAEMDFGYRKVAKQDQEEAVRFLINGRAAEEYTEDAAKVDLMRSPEPGTDEEMLYGRVCAAWAIPSLVSAARIARENESDIEIDTPSQPELEPVDVEEAVAAVLRQNTGSFLRESEIQEAANVDGEDFYQIKRKIRAAMRRLYTKECFAPTDDETALVLDWQKGADGKIEPIWASKLIDSCYVEADDLGDSEEATSANQLIIKARSSFGELYALGIRTASGVDLSTSSELQHIVRAGVVGLRQGLEDKISVAEAIIFEMMAKDANIDIDPRVLDTVLDNIERLYNDYCHLVDGVLPQERRAPEGIRHRGYKPYSSLDYIGRRRKFRAVNAGRF